MSNHLLIFDCDGVLVDSELISLGLLIDYCAAHGLQLDLKMACACFLGKPVADAAREANRIHGASVPDVDLVEFQREITAQFEKHLRPVNGISDVLSKLTNPKCVASSSNMERIELSLRLTGLESYFDGRLFSTDMVARGKPNPDVFLHAAQEMGFETSSAIVIEDSPAGLQAAKAANMKTIAYAGGNHAAHANLKATLEVLSPDVLIDDMADLSGAIDALSS
ncbi:MAG: HAD family hydrolase [Paracoccaceae bacterium]